MLVDAAEGDHDESALRSTSSTSPNHDEDTDDDAYLDQLFESLAKHSKRKSGEPSSSKPDHFKLVDFIEQSVGIQGSTAEDKKIRGRAKNKDDAIGAISVDGNAEPKRRRLRKLRILQKKLLNIRKVVSIQRTLHPRILLHKTKKEAFS